ncbi:MFS transporter [Gemmata sp. JC717]|uniref:MFS transporter n=1 Tax=Gemmata algarum TaxID=2975278 RepID=A0ABU5F1J9_9BACT|nr:MFS transporter [Gemmata algarum]MDY3554873.1 MFS transporter [Gemmata algarum]MDY3559993.1 MFS transporter [Gemmata algarum]
MNDTPPAPGAPARPAPNRGALGIVWLVVFIDLLGFGIVLPVMPRQVEPYLAHLELAPAARGAVIGVLFAVFSLMQFVFSPVWGRVSDRIGRRPVLLLSLLGSVVFYALYGFAVALDAARAELAIGLMLLSRVGAGIAGASVGTAAAVIADCTPPEKRAKGMALIGIAFGAGFTFGPLVGFFGLELFDEQPWGVGALASGLSLVALLVAVFAFKETRDPAHKAGKDFFSVARSVEVLKMPTVGALVLIYFMAIFAFANFEATLALLTRDALGMTNTRENLLVFAAVGAVLTFAGGAYRPMVKKRSEEALLRFGLVLMVAGLAAVGLVAFAAYRWQADGTVSGAQLTAGFYLSISVAVIGFAFVNPSVSALVSKRSDPTRQGEVLGVNQAFASLGRILGPFLGSVLFQTEPSRTLPYAVAVATLVLVGVLLLPKVERPPAGGAA